MWKFIYLDKLSKSTYYPSKGFNISFLWIKSATRFCRQDSATFSICLHKCRLHQAGGSKEIHFFNSFEKLPSHVQVCSEQVADRFPFSLERGQHLLVWHKNLSHRENALHVVVFICHRLTIVFEASTVCCFADFLSFNEHESFVTESASSILYEL